MKNLLILFLIFIPIVGISQVSGLILNKETWEPIPYANISIENTVIGTTSDLNGRFHFNELPSEKRLVISSVGFEIQSISVSDSVLEILLQPKTYEIELITVKPSKNTKKIVVNKIPNRRSSNHLVCSIYSWMSARYFEFKTEYQSCPRVKEIKILTRSNITESKFNIRILSANEKGEPFEDIIGENLIATTKRGNDVVMVNIDSINFRFPENGFFVAVEWLIIDENKYISTYSMKGEKEKRKEIMYDPKFGTFPRQGTNKTWTYAGGNWRQESFTDYSINGEYLDLAIELILTE